MNIKNNDLIFLLGAGCSVEASIPASGTMITKIEKLLTDDPEWKPYLALYNHLKSAIYYASGLKGLFNEAVPYNIETLVNTLRELERNEAHPIYPFIATWNSRFVSLAGNNFDQIIFFRRLILKQLKAWVLLEEPDNASYYSGFTLLQQHLNFPLKLFSLNYDLCVEYLASDSFRVESGFSGIGLTKPWDYVRFDDKEAEHTGPSVYLYKLHGSIDWKRDDKQNVVRLAHTENIKPEEMEVIFGRDFKLEAADPYLFYAYEFRRWILDCKLIVSIGYGFGDEHINKMLSQGLRDDATRRLVIISPIRESALVLKHKQLVAGKLSVPEEQIEVEGVSAKEFLTRIDLAAFVESKIPVSSDPPF